MNGIEHRVTSAVTREQNGSAKVRFRILFRKVRAMLIQSHLPKQCWGCAAMTAVYLTNISPSSSRDVIPYDAWHGHAADCSRIHIFGCVAYNYVTGRPRKRDLRINGTHRNTLDNRGARGIFVGYASNMKAWRILNCESGTITNLLTLILMNLLPTV